VDRRTRSREQQHPIDGSVEVLLIERVVGETAGEGTARRGFSSSTVAKPGDDDPSPPRLRFEDDYSNFYFTGIPPDYSLG
jgi:hypothetical protein